MIGCLLFDNIVVSGAGFSGFSNDSFVRYSLLALFEVFESSLNTGKNRVFHI